MQSSKTYHNKKFEGNEILNSLNNDRQETSSSSINLPSNTTNADDENSLMRKQSKIGI